MSVSLSVIGLIRSFQAFAKETTYMYILHRVTGRIVQ